MASDGSCLFEAVKRAASLPETASELRHRAVKHVLADVSSGKLPQHTESTVRNLYWPDITKGWGCDARLCLPRARHTPLKPVNPNPVNESPTFLVRVHWLQELKMIVKAVDVPELQQAIQDLVVRCCPSACARAALCD